MNWWKIEQGDLLFSHSTRTDSWLKTIIWILTHKQNQKYRWNPDHSCTGWMIKCERGGTNLQMMQQKTATHSVKWRLFMSSTSQACVFMGEELTQKISHWNRCSRYLRKWYPNNQMRSMEWKQLTGKILHGNICLWLVMKKSPVSRTNRFTYFLILSYALERWTRTHDQIMDRKTDWRGLKVYQNTKLWTQLMVGRWNSSVIFSHDSPHCSLSEKSKSSCQKWACNQKVSQDGLSSCRCSTTSHGDLKTKMDADLVLNSFLSMRRYFSQENGHSSDPEKEWYSPHEYKPQGEWDRVAEQMILKFAESGHTVFRSTSPLSEECSKAKVVDNYHTLLRRWRNGWNCYSHNYFC